MKPFKLIKGSLDKINTFEEKVSNAIEEGYALLGPMITHPFEGGILLLQPLGLEEDLDFDDEDFDFEEEEGFLPS